MPLLLLNFYKKKVPKLFSYPILNRKRLSSAEGASTGIDDPFVPNLKYLSLYNLLFEHRRCEDGGLTIKMRRRSEASSL